MPLILIQFGILKIQDAFIYCAKKYFCLIHNEKREFTENLSIHSLHINKSCIVLLSEIVILFDIK